MKRGRIPDDDGGWVVYDETEVWSVRNDKQMKEVAQATDGIHVPLGTSVVDARPCGVGGWPPVGGSESVQESGSSGVAVVRSPWCLVAWTGFHRTSEDRLMRAVVLLALLLQSLTPRERKHWRDSGAPDGRSCKRSSRLHRGSAGIGSGRAFRSHVCLQRCGRIAGGAKDLARAHHAVAVAHHQAAMSQVAQN